MTNCTFSDNTAAHGGDMFVGARNKPTVRNSTFKNNNTSIENLESLVLVNSILWGDGARIIGDTHVTKKNCVIQNGGSGVITADPILGELADNGGPVKTIAISAAGSAYRAGTYTGGGMPVVDARGVSFDVSIPDIGAYAYVPESVDLSVTPAPLEVGRSADISVFVKLTGTASPDTALGAVNLTVSPAGIAEISGDKLIAKALGTVTLKATSKADDTKSKELTVNITKRNAAALAVTTASSDVYTGEALEPVVTVKDGAELVGSKDYDLRYENNTKAGTATVIVTGKDDGDYEGTTSKDFTITPKPLTLTAIPQTITYGENINQGTAYVVPPTELVSGDKLSGITLTASSYGKGDRTGTITPSVAQIENGSDDRTDCYAITYVKGKLTVSAKASSADVTPATRTDTVNSGVIPVGEGTGEDLAIYDAMEALGSDDDLPAGIVIASMDAIAANSADISTDQTLAPASLDVTGAIARYHGFDSSSDDKIQLVTVRASSVTGLEPEEGIFAKIWRMIVSVFTGQHGDSYYLPIEAVFEITSKDLAALPDEVTKDLTKDNFIERVGLYAVISADNGVNTLHARNLVDVSSADTFIKVAYDSTNDSFTITTRALVFDMAGTVSADRGEPWVQAVKTASGDQRPEIKDYFLVQDGAKDDVYNLTLAFAARVPNKATVSLVVSGDIEPDDVAFVKWKVSGDQKQYGANDAAYVSSGDQSVSLSPTGGYHVTLSDGTQTLSPDVMPITKNVPWGGDWKITAAFEKITVAGVTLDKTALVLAPGGSDKLTATVTPDDAYAKDVTWTTSDKNIAEIAEDGTITAKTAGRATITATANDGGGAPAACAVTVRNNAGDDPTAPSLTPELIVHAIARPSEIELADNTASYVTDAAKQTTVATAAGFLDEDTALTETGALAAGSTVVNGAVNDVIAKDPAISKDIVYALPIVESKAAKAGMLHAISFKVSGDIFGEVTGAEIRVLKVFPDGTGELFTPISAPEEIADKTAALYDTNEAMVTGAIDKEADYILTVFVKDGESFDLDGKRGGTVIDPVSIIKAAAVEPDQPDNTRSHNGGCNTGAAGIAMLFLLVPAAIINKKRK